MSVYRDATVSAETVDLLREAYHALNRSGHKTCAAAVADVIKRWDANDATEMTLEESS